MKTVSLSDVRRQMEAQKRHPALSSIDEIIDDARQGKIVILVDDEDRENEGDLVVPAEKVTPEVINFMAKFGRGLICLAMTGERVRELGLGLMSQNNGTRHQTAFTVSIEAREGISTGISAYDRAHTVKVAIDPTKGAGDIVTPGHVFPLMARDGGTLVRAGHTEASVDIARLAGLNPSGVICEIMSDDGSMARLPELISFAQLHGIKIGTIADLIAYRRRNDSLIERMVETQMDSRYGGTFRMIVYRNKVEYAEHIALIKGDISGPEPIMVRVHALNVLEDVLGDKHGRGGILEASMRAINEAGRGIVILIREPRPQALSSRVRRRLGEPVDNDAELRDYGIGAQILSDLGVKNMILLSNHRRTIVGLEGYDLHVVENRQLTLPEDR